MHDKPELSEQQLRLATSRSLPSGAALDAEAAAERDGFLALGGALDAAAGQFDEGALIARLQRTCLTKDDATIALPPPGRASSTWQAVFSVALAAAALLAIVRIAAPLAVTSPARKMLVAKQESSRSPKMPRAAGIAEATSLSRGLWFDPLDDEIALAQAEFQRLAGGERGVDGSLSQMNDRLEALSQELFGGSL